ncbi:hypothetical protein Ahy_A01g000369 [Arachis hypogaea]|uniref:Transposase MuDR plant domain-containing protein n=1 Tax=Arachis hypogaea TaxID=3818 RepID=A0A445EK57_ARAHY|nr:hypothetical protein Ahy_A01g000369 [Arachis hypogaea]
MDDDVKSHDGSAIRDPMMDQYEVNPDDRDDAKEEPPEIPDDDRPFTQGGPDEDLSDEFEVGQQFKNKEEVLLTVKQYSIKRVAEYKIVKSDQLRYNAQCIQFRLGCNWCILISYRRKQEKWEVRRYTGFHTCMQTLMGQDHGRLDSKVIAQHIFTMVKADPTISIMVLQGGVKNHFGYKASYRKVWLANKESLLEYMVIRRSHTMSFLVGYSLCRCTCLVRFISNSVIHY